MHPNTTQGVIDGDYVWIRVHQDDASSILRLNGFSYAGATLTIEETSEPMPQRSTEPGMSQNAMDTKSKLMAVLASRYNAQQGLLDLSAIGLDPTLASLGTFETKSLAEKSFRVLLHLAGSEHKHPGKKDEAIQAVSLARNGITDVSQVFSLAFSLPRLRRLDLSDNKLDTLSKISKWRFEFRHLEELHLTGNPVVNQPDYMMAVIKWFPSLQILDGHRVRTPEEAAAAVRASYPTPLPQLPSCLRDGGNNVSESFLRAFFPLYDHDRRSLVSQFYDGDSTFSLIIVTHSDRDLSSKAYLKYSRNVQTLGSRNPATIQRLFTGGNLIAELWNTLPATRHPGLDEPAQWLVDCHTFPHLADPSGNGTAMGLTIDANGRFDEAIPDQGIFGTRTFSRHFILGPSKPGAPYPYRVISDRLTLHHWTPHDPAAGIAAPPMDAAPDAATAPAVPVAPPMLDDATRAQLIQQLSNQTGMTAEYSELCLSGTANWNFEMALQSFHERKESLPPEAFIISPA